MLTSVAKSKKPSSKIKNIKYMRILAHVFAAIGVYFLLFVDIIAGAIIIILAAIGYASAIKKDKPKPI